MAFVKFKKISWAAAYTSLAHATLQQRQRRIGCANRRHVYLTCTQHFSKDKGVLAAPIAATYRKLKYLGVGIGGKLVDCGGSVGFVGI